MGPLRLRPALRPAFGARGPSRPPARGDEADAPPARSASGGSPPNQNRPGGWSAGASGPGRRSGTTQRRRLFFVAGSVAALGLVAFAMVVAAGDPSKNPAGGSGPQPTTLAGSNKCVVSYAVWSYDRLARTAEVMGTIGFGTKADADRVTRRVRAMHRRVSGRLGEPAGPYPAGTPYRADDPELLLWVLFTLVDSGLVVYRNYVGGLSRAEEAAYWEDYRVVGRLFGLRQSDMPRTLADLDDYRREMLGGRQPPRDPVGARAGAGDRAGAAGAALSPAARGDGRTSSRSPCCRTGSGTSTASRRCRRAFVRKALVRAGGEYVRRAVVPFLPERLRLVPAARAA